ncbi:MAG: ATP-binding cassette domain-containing protein [Acidobacteriota bacterium]
MLKAERLSRVVDGRAIVCDVSFEVARGEIVAVTGPSGSGKSSLLRLLNRLDEPTSGTVYFEGIDYRLIPPRELRRRIGMVSQTAFLFPGTVGDNVRYGPRLRGRELPDAAVAALLARVGLPDFAAEDAVHLSGGEAQRLSLARALANEPHVLLLDEPTSALDAGARRAVEELILKIVRESGLTCVVVTHDAVQAARVAARTLEIRPGGSRC